MGYVENFGDILTSSQCLPSPLGMLPFETTVTTLAVPQWWYGHRLETLELWCQWLLLQNILKTNLSEVTSNDKVGVEATTFPSWPGQNVVSWQPMEGICITVKWFAAGWTYSRTVWRESMENKLEFSEHVAVLKMSDFVIKLFASYLQANQLLTKSFSPTQSTLATCSRRPRLHEVLSLAIISFNSTRAKKSWQSLTIFWFILICVFQNKNEKYMNVYTEENYQRCPHCCCYGTITIEAVWICFNHQTAW